LTAVGSTGLFKGAGELIGRSTGVEMDSGKATILNLEPVDKLGLPHGDRMLRAVREAAAGVYDLLGELGRNRYGSIVYLGRELATGGLTALKLDVSPGNPNELELTVAAELDESIPALGYECHYCGQRLDSWGRFCTSCGRDVSGVTTERMVPLERQELLHAVRDAAAGEYEILGEMQRARGGGIVYFARELASDQIIALRLQREKRAEGGDEAEYSLGRTQVLKPLVESAEHRHSAEPAQRPSWEPLKPDADNSVGRGPELARGEVTERPASEQEPTPQPPVVPPRNPIRRQHVVMAAVGLGVLIATGVVIATSRDEQRPKVPQVVENPPPPPPPPPASPPPPPPVPDSGELVFDRLPRGTQVVIDGVPRKGTAFKLPVGKHLVEATAPGYYRSKLEIEVALGQTRRGLRFVQLPDTSKKVVTGQQSGTQPVDPPKPTCASTASAYDWSNARTLCAAEARGGNAAAERQMGVMFLRGLGGPIDEDEAVTWLQRSAARGDRDSEYDLGRIFQTSPRRHNDERALDYLTRAANQGHVGAEFQLGRIHEKGIGTPKNLTEAFRWFRAAAEQGHAEAQAGLALFYMKAQGTTRDDTKALEWLRKGAAGNSSTAMYYLGVFYEDGRAGLPKSRSQAREWYTKSADLGNAEAKKALGRN
jgi:TPR repeat protein